jgi:hypothetical protein
MRMLRPASRPASASKRCSSVWCRSPPLRRSGDPVISKSRCSLFEQLHVRMRNHDGYGAVTKWPALVPMGSPGWRNGPRGGSLSLLWKNSQMGGSRSRTAGPRDVAGWSMVGGSGGSGRHSIDGARCRPRCLTCARAGISTRLVCRMCRVTKRGLLRRWTARDDGLFLAAC